MSVIKRVLSFQERFNDSEPEDEWFGKRLWVLPGAKIASKLEGAISVEDVYMERPVGFHIREGGGDLNESMWSDAARRREIFEYCPEVSMIMDMKLERERCPDDDGSGNREDQEAQEGPVDVEVTTAVLEGEDEAPVEIEVAIAVLGEGGHAQTSSDTEPAMQPPQPPPLPHPWKASATTMERVLRTGIH